MRATLLLLLATAALAVAALVGAAGPAHAAQSGGVMELDPIVVEGQIQRPEAAYIIQRATLDFGMTAKKRSFIGKVKASIDEAPF
jgi:hypothetical protein